MERETKIEKRASYVLSVLFGPFLFLTPELGMFILSAFVNPSSVLAWNPWYYPLGFLSTLVLLVLSALSYKYTYLAALKIWGFQSLYCFLWVLGKFFIFKQGMLLSLWFIVCGVVSLIVSVNLFRNKKIV